ncbi:MAG: MgtC/SapB family protein [Candidatus Dormibacteria bacterium]
MELAIGFGSGEGWLQFGELALALLLGSAIGLERELRQKAAGMRTNALVGLGACLFMLISKYGFTDVLSPGRVVLDPSRVAAQIVTGIGFIGGGLIFVRRDLVRGLTTAAVVWLTAAVGAAAGAGLPLLAVAATGGHFLVIYGYTPLVHRLQGQGGAPTQIRVRYSHASGALRRVISLCTQGGFTVMELSVERDPGADDDDGGPAARRHPSEARAVDVLMIISGRGSIPDLVSDLSAVPGVVAVNAGVDESGSESP